MSDIQAQANQRFAAQVRANRQREEAVRAARRRKGEEHRQACRAIQWRTRIAAVERKLVEVKGLLRYSPQDAGLRAQCETLEKMYAELLSEQPQDTVALAEAK